MVEKKETKEKFDQHDANELVDIGGKVDLESAQQSNCVPKKMSTQICFFLRIIRLQKKL